MALSSEQEYRGLRQKEKEDFHRRLRKNRIPPQREAPNEGWGEDLWFPPSRDLRSKSTQVIGGEGLDAISTIGKAQSVP